MMIEKRNEEGGSWKEVRRKKVESSREKLTCNNEDVRKEICKKKGGIN